MDPEIILTPWSATGNFTETIYNNLVSKFGVEKISSELLARFQKITGQKPHKLLRRNIFFAHREFDKILDDIQSGQQIFIYTGRGPSTESMHMGHIIPIQFAVWLQKIFNCIVIFQLADDEKYWYKNNNNFEDIYKLGLKNSQEIISCGFNPKKTFIFSNRVFCSDPIYRKTAYDIMKHTNINTIKSIFGITDSNNIGQLVWPCFQTAAAFSNSFEKLFHNKNIRCLIIYAIDQDPYFRLGRDLAGKLGFLKPCSLICKFLPSLDNQSKLSSTGPNLEKTIFISDNLEQITRKINKYAFSGGRDTIQEHRLLGGNIEIDIPCIWLKYFVEGDTQLAKIESDYKSGKLLSGEIKKILVNQIWDIIQEFNMEKNKLTPEIINKFFDINNIEN